MPRVLPLGTLPRTPWFPAGWQAVRVDWQTAFEGLGDEERDVVVALVSCGGLVGADDLYAAASAWVAARGRALDRPAFDAALAGSFVASVTSGTTGLYGPADASVADLVREWLAGRPAELRAFVTSVVFFDQVGWVRDLARGDEAVRPDVFAAARRTYDTRAVEWRPRTGKARKGAPAYLPPQRDPMARLHLVAELLDRDDVEAREWVSGLLPTTRDQWAGYDRASVVAALPSLADLLPDGAAALAAQALVGDERHGFGWADLADLRDRTPDVFGEEVWDDLRKRFARWAKRRLTYPIDEKGRAELATTATRLGVDLGHT